MKKKLIIAVIIFIILILSFFITWSIINNNNKEKIDVYVSTNHFVTKINGILDKEDEYKGKRVSINGYLKIDEYNNMFITRTYLNVNGNTEVGLLLKGKNNGLKNGDWINVVGRINYEVESYSSKKKVPYIYIEKIEKVKKQEDDEYVIN